MSAIYCSYDYYGSIYLANFILITYYWVSVIEHISGKKIRNNTVEAPFVIPGVSTKWKSDLRFRPIVESEIGFLLEFDRYSND